MPNAYALFCADPISPRTADSAFSSEFEAASAAGLIPILLDHDEIELRGDVSAALRRTRIEGTGSAVYRGWMMKSDRYRVLYNGLRDRGATLINSPEQYSACHHAPGSYSSMAAWMAPMKWVEESPLTDWSTIDDALDTFGSIPVILKDWVKSQASGYWNEACFIPNASDRATAHRVIERFRELQGEDLVGGLVFKSYLPLLPAGSPADEQRAFFVDGQVVGCWPRSVSARSHGTPPDELLTAVGKAIPSRFASADFGIDEAGRWWLLEVGDGQVSGLPDAASPDDLLGPLAQAFQK